VRLLILAALLGAAAAASAQMYRWTDERGRVHVTDTPPPPTAKNVQSRPATGYGEAAGATLPYALQRAAKDYPVTLYTAPDCAPCGQARSLLNARGVPFREVSVTDEQQQAELQQVAGSLSVPTIRVGASVQKGFEQGAYHALLDTAGYPATGILPPRSQSAPKPQAASSAPPGEASPTEESDEPKGPYAPR
jgi:glutaredoxin